MGKQLIQCQAFFLGLQNHCRWWLQPWKGKTLTPWKKSYDPHRQCFKGRDITLPTKVHMSNLSFPNSRHVCMGELDHKESWALKNWFFWTVVLGKNLESPLDCKEINAVNARGNQSWIFIGRGNDEAPILWSSETKTDSLENALMQGKIEGQRRRGRQRMWWLDGITILMGLNFKQALGVGDGQWSLMCCRQ